MPLLRQKAANGTEGQALSDVLSDAPNVFYSMNSEPPPLLSSKIQLVISNVL